jgi:preprotein translocase subunit YajC
MNMITILAQAQADGGGSILGMLIPFALIFVLFYFLMIRPQQRKEKERVAMINNVQKNDHVITSGGFYGVVTNVKDTEVQIRIDDESDVKVRLAKSAIIGVVKKGQE